MTKKGSYFLKKKKGQAIVLNGYLFFDLNNGVQFALLNRRRIENTGKQSMVIFST